MELKTLEFINSHSNWEELLSSPPYNIIIKWKEPFVLLKYNQIESDMSNEIVQECRGLILKKIDNKFKVASMRFKKFFNYGQSQASKLSLEEPLIVSQKIDGSLIGVWYDEVTGWHISTSGNIDAEDAPLQFQTDKLKTYKDLFMEAFNKYHLNFDMFDKNYTIYYELVSPYNRIVVPYKDIDLYWLGARDNNTLEEYNFKDMLGCLTNIPKWFECKTMQEVEKAVKKLTDKDEHFEGFVVEDYQGNRVKLKSTQYMNLFFIKGDGIFSEKKILKLILEEEDDDVLGYFPEYTDDFNRIRELFNTWTQVIRNNLIEGMDKLSLERKTFAEWAKNTVYPNIIFEEYKNQGWNDEWLINYIKSLPLDRLIKLIRTKGE